MNTTAMVNRAVFICVVPLCCTSKQAKQNQNWEGKKGFSNSGALEHFSAVSTGSGLQECS